MGAHRLAHPVPRAPRAGLRQRDGGFRQPAPRAGGRREGRGHAQHLLPGPLRARDHRVRRRRGLRDLPARHHHEHPQELGRPGPLPGPAAGVRHGAVDPDGHVRRSALRPAAIRPVELQPDRRHGVAGDRLGRRAVAARGADRARRRHGGDQPGGSGVAPDHRAPSPAVVPPLPAAVRPLAAADVHLGFRLVLHHPSLRRDREALRRPHRGRGGGSAGGRDLRGRATARHAPTADHPTADVRPVHEGGSTGGPSEPVGAARQHRRGGPIRPVPEHPGRHRTRVPGRPRRRGLAGAGLPRGGTRGRTAVRRRGRAGVGSGAQGVGLWRRSPAAVRDPLRHRGGAPRGARLGAGLPVRRAGHGRGGPDQRRRDGGRSSRSRWPTASSETPSRAAPCARCAPWARRRCVTGVLAWVVGARWRPALRLHRHARSDPGTRRRRRSGGRCS